MHRILPSLHPEFMVCKNSLARIKSYDSKDDKSQSSLKAMHDMIHKIMLPDNYMIICLKYIMSLLEPGTIVTEKSFSSKSDGQQAACSEDQNILLQQATMYHQQEKHDESLSVIDKIFQSQEEKSTLPSPITYHIHDIEMNCHKQQGHYAAALDSLHEMEKSMDSFPLWKTVLSGRTLLERADIYAAQNEDEEVLKMLDQYRSIFSSQYFLPGKNYDKESLKSLVRRFRQRGSDYFQRGSYHEAISAHEKALRISLEFLPDDYSQQITAYDLIAMSYYALKDYSSTLVNSYKIVDLVVKASVSCDVHMENIWGRIGLSHFNLNEYDQALVAFDNRHEILINDPTSDPVKLAHSYEFIGQIYLLREDFEGAVEYLNRALHIRNNHLSPFSSQAPPIWACLGYAQRLRKSYNESLHAYKQELQIYMAKSTPDPKKLADVYRNIGVVHMMTENFSAAKLNLEECLKIHTTIGSSDDLVLGIMHDCNAHMLLKEKQYLACGDHGISAIKIYRRDFSRIHERIEPLRKLLGIAAHEIRRLHQIKQDANDQKLTHKSLLKTLMEKEDFEKALFHAKKLFQIQTTLFADDELDICTTLCYLSSIYLALGHFSAALHCLHKSKVISLKHLPRTTSLLISILHTLGKSYQTLGEYEDALSSYDDALELQLNILPADHLQIAIIYKLIGSVYLITNKIDEARSNFLKCLDIQINKLPHDHPDLITTRDILQTFI